MRVRTGIDAVEIHRFRVALERTPAMIDRLFTVSEVTSVSGRVESLAARFCVKEATMKLFGVGLGAVPFHDIETVRLETGQPSLRLTGAAATLALEQGCHEFALSLTHTRTLAIAQVVSLIEG
ncbi:MAG: holo-ACP synthase [Ferrimicrobium sp.]|jgi:holo-[acyl-carrier protein] synthase|uniref:Holo-[acyl-carrier-protein] synthase n=1 Tax=Ferrimicrobium acidiphilum TaxID=121039 RepID=A0ABV3XYV9_9ACTN|nr:MULTISPECIES: holo-ACP synthase [Ferrimicrobium]MCL5972905.1 holo-ACP synthase [Actinomycetota bacterium]